MDQWKERKRPLRLEKRFEFSDYESTRDFLDLVGNHTEKIQKFPDISFGKTYVNITIRPEKEDELELTLDDYNLAKDIDNFA